MRGTHEEFAGISIHAPHAGSDPSWLPWAGPSKFQSTLPMRGATLASPPCSSHSNFNPRSPCGERPARKKDLFLRPYFNPRSPCGERSAFPLFCTALIISIHAPHAGSDWPMLPLQDFQQISIHAPHAGSDVSGEGQTQDGQISIHAPHAGSDRL